MIEASAAPGADVPARLARRHRKQALQPTRFVTSEEWAPRYVAQAWDREVVTVDDVVKRLASSKRILQVTSERQMTPDLT